MSDWKASLARMSTGLPATTVAVPCLDCGAEIRLSVLDSSDMPYLRKVACSEVRVHYLDRPHHRSFFSPLRRRAMVRIHALEVSIVHWDRVAKGMVIYS